MTEHKVPCWRYHATQGAKLFTIEEDVDAAEAAGWRDSPGAAALEVEAPINEPQEAMPDDGVSDALEIAEDAIEAAQKVIRKRRKR